MTPKRPTLAELGDEWYESEPSLRTGLAEELRRVGRRTAARPVRVIFLAALITAAITHRIVTKVPVAEAEVVLALSEEALAERRHTGLPAAELREYVTSVLMSDHRLLAIIDKWNLHPLRARLGPEYALSELREQISIEIWKNTFAHYDLDDYQARKSARIGITVLDANPTTAMEIAQELARAVIAAHEAEQHAVTAALAQQVVRIRDATERELERLATEISFKQTALARAKRQGKHVLASALYVDLTALAHVEKVAEAKLSQIAQSRDAIADAIATAGLDVSLRVIDERRPASPDRGGLGLLVAIVAIGTCSLLGSALVLGAFDTRIYDPEDVKRLGLPMLGQVP